MGLVWKEDIMTMVLFLLKYNVDGQNWRIPEVLIRTDGYGFQLVVEVEKVFGI